MPGFKNDAHPIQKKTQPKHLKYPVPTNNFFQRKYQVRMFHVLFFFFFSIYRVMTQGKSPRTCHLLHLPPSTLMKTQLDPGPQSMPCKKGGPIPTHLLCGVCRVMRQALIVFQCLHQAPQELGSKVTPSLAPHQALFPGRQDL